MRVTVMTGIFPPDVGGPATSVPDLIADLASAGWRPTVVTLADSPSSLAADLFPVTRIARVQRWPLRTAAVVRAVLASRPNVVLANGLHLESALLAPPLPLAQKIVGDWAWERAVNAGRFRGSIGDFQAGLLPPRVRALRVLRTAASRRARRVIVPSRYLAGLVSGWGVAPKRIEVIENAAPPPMPSTNKRSPRVLFVGRLVAWKHVDDALAAIAHVPRLSLDIVGDGPEEEALRGQAERLGLVGRVVFHGRLSRTDTLEHMRTAAALVLPSSYEGMPHVVLESFALGLPVVATAAGGTPELVQDGETGLLVACHDRDGLAAALRRVTEPGLSGRLARGGAAVAARLTRERSTSAMARLLGELAR